MDLQGKLILDPGASTSMGGVDLLTDIQEFYAGYGLYLNSRPAPPMRFSFANGDEDWSDRVFSIPYIPWRAIFHLRVLNKPGPILLGSDVHRDLGLVVDHDACTVRSKYYGYKDHTERLRSNHMVLDVMGPENKYLLQHMSMKAWNDLQAGLWRAEARSVSTPEACCQARGSGEGDSAEAHPESATADPASEEAYGYTRISRSPLLRRYRSPTSTAGQQHHTGARSPGDDSAEPPGDGSAEPARMTHSGDGSALPTDDQVDAEDSTADLAKVTIALESKDQLQTYPTFQR